MPRFQYDREFVQALGMTPSGPMSPKFDTVEQLRQFTQDVLDARSASAPQDDTVARKQLSFKSFDGAEVSVTHFIPPHSDDSAGPLPAVVYLHGGGMVAGKVEHFATSLALYTRESGFPFFAVEYRLAPEFHAPAAIEDSYGWVQHLVSHADEFNIDPSRIALMGVSAGGGIAASVALLARERQLSPPIAMQMLICPMLDDRTTSPGDDTEAGKLLFWKASYNKLGWDAYLNKKDGKIDPKALAHYAVPARVDDLHDLPTTYLDVGTVDLFMEEGIQYGTKLTQHGVQLEMHIWPGLPHGWEGASSTSWYKKAIDLRVAALKRIGQ